MAAGTGFAAADPTRASVSGFSGWLVITPDADWNKKWRTPEHVIPAFTIADEVQLGETLHILIFYANPKLSSQANVDVRCEIKVTRPDGAVALDEDNLDCASGPITGPVTDLRVSGNTLEFVAEPSDPPGKWTVEVTLHDVHANVVLPLKAHFTLKIAPN
jgi:hypothetical protein